MSAYFIPSNAPIVKHYFECMCCWRDNEPNPSCNECNGKGAVVTETPEPKFNACYSNARALLDALGYPDRDEVCGTFKHDELAELGRRIERLDDWLRERYYGALREVVACARAEGGDITWA